MGGGLRESCVNPALAPAQPPRLLAARGAFAHRTQQRRPLTALRPAADARAAAPRVCLYCC
jgi:hypothetical protein